MKRPWGRERATGTREPVALPSVPSKRWSLDFVTATFGASRRLCIVAVIDGRYGYREFATLLPSNWLGGERHTAERIWRQGSVWCGVSIDAPPPTRYPS